MTARPINSAAAAAAAAPTEPGPPRRLCGVLTFVRNKPALLLVAVAVLAIRRSQEHQEGDLFTRLAAGDSARKVPGANTSTSTAGGGRSDNATLLPVPSSPSRGGTRGSLLRFNPWNPSDPSTEQRLNLKPSTDPRTEPTNDTSRRQRIAYISPVNLVTKNSGTEYFGQRNYGAKRFENVTIASFDTWFADSKGEPRFLVIGDSQRDIFNSATYCGDGSRFERYCKSIVPIFVDCEDIGHTVVCCKYEKGLLQVFEQYEEAYDWFLYTDDDIYIRREMLNEYIKPLDPLDAAVLLSGRFYTMWLGKLGESSVWGPVSKYSCSNDVEYMYPWGLVSVYSHGALERAMAGLRAGGLVKQCFEYGVQSDNHMVGQDAGSAIFNWMYSFPSLPIHVCLGRGNASDFRYFGIHYRGSWAEIHELYSNAPPAQSYHFTYKWHNVTGFRRTALYRDFGDPWTWTDWHTMNISDCAGDDPSKKGPPYFRKIAPYVALS